MSLMIEDFCLQKMVGVGGVVGPFTNRMIEQTSSGWFDGAVLLEFLQEIVKRHEGDFPKKDMGDIKMSFWKMSDDNPNKSDDVGDLICLQVGDKTYGVCPVRRND
ncbi:hypothetical protein ACKUB1_09725 [Methanospirillum stamsii]|uniref:Uncharacterized protein n=1 Tax=Methanospirillum stamsii TaxID=1277351 RepID=A0A2V2N5K6_9EURY|nr:hypothetical protein [Methanospirillum stamsii]PWR75352.1 hypothetical protein DLD82_04245 [Methanospirillum stamsii]